MDGVTILNTIPERSFPWALVIIVLAINTRCRKDYDMVVDDFLHRLGNIG